MARRKHFKKTRHYMKKTQKKHKRRTRKRGRHSKHSMRGGSTKPLLNVGSGLFKHMNFSNGFVPDILGNLKKNVNYLWGGKDLFKDFYPDILNLGTN